MCTESFFQIDLSFEDLLIKSTNEANSFHILILRVLIIPQKSESIDNNPSDDRHHDNNDEYREEIIKEKPL